MFHDFVNWIREDLGRFTEDGQSWSNQLHESLFMWNIIEGTHVLTIMFFAGTIWLIDLRMMGVAFRNVPLSKLNDKVLPITMMAFAFMIITGIVAFVGRDPLMYYHNIWFRLKMLFLLVAMGNILWFHYKVQKSQPEWDAMPPESDTPAPRSSTALWVFLGATVATLLTFPFQLDLTTTVVLRMALSIVALVSLFIYIHKRNPNPPLVVKLSGAISFASWFLVIIFGRFIAYDWFYCEKTDPGSLAYVLQECDVAISPEEEGSGESEEYIEEEGVTEEGAEGDAVEGEEPTEGEATEDPPTEEEAPADPAPAQPVPGQGG